MNAKTPEARSLRFRVTLELLHPHPAASYEVATLHGELKAVVLATRAHVARGDGHILAVSVEPLEGAKPQGTDLVDRLEW